MQENKQNNNEIIAKLCGHENDKEYIEKFNKLYKNCLTDKANNTWFRNKGWEARTKLPNNIQIVAYGKTFEECKENLHRKTVKYMNEYKKEQQKQSIKQEKKIEQNEEMEMEE